MHFSRRTALLLAAALCCSGAVHAADERGSKDEAKAMVDAAFEHIKKVGADKAYKDFTTDKAAWNKKDLYVMVYDSKGVALAHGANEKLVGKDMTAVKDANGVAIVNGMIALAAKGGYTNIPESQTPWQEIFRANVEQLSEGMVLKPAVKYQKIAQSKGLPRDNH